MLAIARGVGLEGMRALTVVAAVTSLSGTSAAPARAQLGGINQVLAITGSAAPDGNGELNTVRDYPVINSAGQVLFTAKLAGTADGAHDNEGIYRADSGGVTQIFRSRRAVGFQTGYSDLWAESINAAGEVVFAADQLQPLIGATPKNAIYRSTGGAVTRLAAVGQASPTGAGTINSLGIGVLNSAGDVAFLAEHSPAPGPYVDTALFVQRGGTLHQLAREGQPAPDGDGVITNIIGTTLNDQGQATFLGGISGTAGGAGDGEAIFRADSSSVQVIAKAGQSPPDSNGAYSTFFHVIYSSSVAMNASGQTAFRAKLSGTSGGSADDEGLYAWNGAAVTQVARKGQTAPGGGVFTEMGLITINNAMRTSFLARIDDAGDVEFAIYRAEGSTLTQLARTGMSAPGGNGTFTTLWGGPLNDSGHVLFSANLAGTSGGVADDKGLYLANGIDVIQIAREGQSLAGSTITRIDYNPGGIFTSGPGMNGFNEASQAAYHVELANGKEAIVRFTIPELHWNSIASGVWSGVNFTNGIAPNSFHHVFINPLTASPTVQGKTTDFFVRSLTIGTQNVGVSTLRITNGGDMTALESVTINNGGAVVVGPGHTVTAQALVNYGQLRGAGRVDAALSNQADGWLAVDSGATFQFGGAGPHSNDGAIWAANGELRFLNHLVQSPAGETNIESGVLRLDVGMTNGGRVHIALTNNEIHGDFSNLPSGAVSLDPGGEVQFFGDVTNDGSFEAVDGTETTFHALLAGKGVGNRGDVKAEGDVQPGAGAGLMAFGGNLRFSPTTRLHIDIGGLLSGAEHDALQVAERITLDGELVVSPLSTGGAPFEPQPGDRFRIIEADSVISRFSQLTVAGFAPGLKFSLENEGHGVVLVTAALFAADFDLDGQVDKADLALWSSNFGMAGASHAQGDADGNDVVDGADLLILQRQLGATATRSGASAPIRSIPEPRAATLASFAAALCVRGRRRRHALRRLAGRQF